MLIKTKNNFLTKSLKYLKEISRALSLPYYFGFVRGHYYLTKNQLLEIKECLHSHDSEKITEEYELRFANLIGDGYGISFAAGRMAFYSLLKAFNISQGDEVILPGFTCSVMVNAVWRIGAIPIFTDIDSETFGSDAKEIEKKITPRTKVIVAQHSFGIPCNIQEIVELGKKYGIPVIEDSAIAIDSAINGIKVGNWGDAAIFSTDHSKPLNTLIGGFLYTKNKDLYKKIKDYSDVLPHLDKVHQKRLYKQLLFEKKYYNPGYYQRVVFLRNIVSCAKSHFHNKRRQCIFLEADYRKQSSSEAGYPYPAKMPPFLARLGIFELERWYEERERRRELLKGYLKITEESGFIQFLPKAYYDKHLDIIPLRFAFCHPYSKTLIRLMDNYIDTSWIWFRQPVICCPDGPENLGYTFGSCPKAENIALNIINWPCVLPEGWERKTLHIFKRVLNAIMRTKTSYDKEHDISTHEKRRL